MPLITRRSSTRGTPLALFGNIGCKRAHCLSSNQNSPAISDSTISTIDRLFFIPKGPRIPPRRQEEKQSDMMNNPAAHITLTELTHSSPLSQ
jgi:hypothetical protein